MNRFITSAIAALAIKASAADVLVQGQIDPVGPVVDITTPLRDAINTVYAQGGVIWIEGRCSVTQTINNPGVTIKGTVTCSFTGNYNTMALIHCYGPGDGFVLYNSDYRVPVMQDLVLIGYHLSLGNKNQDQAGIRLQRQAYQGAVVERVMVTRFNTGILLDRETSQLRLRDSRIESARYNGFSCPSPSSTVDHRFTGLLHINGLNYTDFGKTNQPPKRTPVGINGLPASTVADSILIDECDVAISSKDTLATTITNLKIDSFGTTAIAMGNPYPLPIYSPVFSVGHLLVVTPHADRPWPVAVANRTALRYVGTGIPAHFTANTAIFSDGGTGACIPIDGNPLLKTLFNIYLPTGKIE